MKKDITCTCIFNWLMIRSFIDKPKKYRKHYWDRNQLHEYILSTVKKLHVFIAVSNSCRENSLEETVCDPRTNLTTIKEVVLHNVPSAVFL